jgi:hypothetical protein
MKPFLFYVFLFGFFVTYGQHPGLGKKELLKVINITMNHKLNAYNACENGLCGEWYTSNKDSAFYRNDTVRIYNTSNIMYDTNHYCNFKVLELSRANKFSQHSIDICHEPPISTIEGTYSINLSKGQKKGTKIPTAPENYRIVEKDSSTFLLLYTGSKIFYKFKLLEISNNDVASYGEQSFVITFVRQQVKQP